MKLAVQPGTLFPEGPFTNRLDLFPSLRFMGSKFRLLSWISQIASELRFETVLDAFSGSGCVAYLFKSLGKAVTANDAMNISATIARALIENRETIIAPEELRLLLEYDSRHLTFIQQTFDGIKRYRFLEGLSLYWKDAEILAGSRVKKLKKRFTPFSYRKTALDAFERLFRKFRASTLVLSYSSNGFPDLDVLIELMRRYKERVVVHSKDHRYHFGTHDAAARNEVTEHLTWKARRNDLRKLVQSQSIGEIT